MKFRNILAVILALLMAVTTPAQVLADAKPVYVSDVMVGMGETAEEAKKALTDAGFTVLDHNVNEGAGSAFKTEKFVYMGYKTTADASEAITDLAAMNMNGGYSFSDYEVLMNKYRDSQIRPFIDSFIATIKEYRENYDSDIPGNKAKADFAYSILSHIIEDDSGANMGDLLLNPTKEERGLTDDQYKALSKEEKRKTADLTTALMQGNSQVVSLMEQMLAIAADTNETTWLERLSELGPDGLDAKYAEAGVRPSDAVKEMAGLYNDTAKAILVGWVDLRAELLSYEAASDEGPEGETAGTTDVEINAQYDVPETVSGGETADSEKLAEDIEKVMDTMAGVMEIGAELGEKTEGSDITGIYGFLKELPYGDGTLYDFFTLDYTEVSGDNLSALYPLVSTLSAGQAAAIDLLSLKTLVQIGSTSGDAFEQFSPENSNMVEGIDFLGGVSIYLDVNRELFGDKVALTSEALRSGLDKNAGWMMPDSDLLGLSRLTTLSWAATGFFGAMTLVSVLKHASAPARFEKALEQFQVVDQAVQEFYQQSDDLFDSIDIMYDYVKIRVDVLTENTRVTFDYVDIVEEAGTTYFEDEIVMHYTFDKSYNIKGKYKSIENFHNQFKHAKESSESAVGRWGVLKVTFGVVFALLALTSLGLTIYDLYRYYNIKYTPIPKYIVDEADITTADEEGNRLVVRNDAAYYTVASTNRPENHEQHEALQNYADLNGDVGQQWLALYSVKLPGGEPILADSFKAVTGTTSIPEGYTKGIHMFGSSAAANLTDSRYTYNDKQNGIYVYYKTEATTSSETASVFSGNAIALVGAGCGLAGAALGSLVTVFVKKKKEELQPE